jgi:hypothetical protein
MFKLKYNKTDDKTHFISGGQHQEVINNKGWNIKRVYQELFPQIAINLCCS